MKGTMMDNAILVLNLLSPIILAIIGAKWIWSIVGKKLISNSKIQDAELKHNHLLEMKQFEENKEENLRVERALRDTIKKMEETLAKHEARLKLLEEERLTLVTQNARLEAELTSEKKENKRLNEALARLRLKIKEETEHE